MKRVPHSSAFFAEGGRENAEVARIQDPLPNCGPGSLPCLENIILNLA